MPPAVCYFTCWEPLPSLRRSSVRSDNAKGFRKHKRGGSILAGRRSEPQRRSVHYAVNATKASSLRSSCTTTASPKSRCIVTLGTILPREQGLCHCWNIPFRGDMQKSPTTSQQDKQVP